MLERYIKDLFLEKTLNFFHIGVKKLENQVRNEILRQMTITLTLTLTLRLGVPAHPMDAKGLNRKKKKFCYHTPVHEENKVKHNFIIHNNILYPSTP